MDIEVDVKSVCPRNVTECSTSSRSPGAASNFSQQQDRWTTSEQSGTAASGSNSAAGSSTSTNALSQKFSDGGQAAEHTFLGCSRRILMKRRKLCHHCNKRPVTITSPDVPSGEVYQFCSQLCQGQAKRAIMRAETVQCMLTAKHMHAGRGALAPANARKPTDCKSDRAASNKTTTSMPSSSSSSSTKCTFSPRNISPVARNTERNAYVTSPRENGTIGIEATFSGAVPSIGKSIRTRRPDTFLQMLQQRDDMRGGQSPTAAIQRDPTPKTSSLSEQSSTNQSNANMLPVDLAARKPVKQSIPSLTNGSKVETPSTLNCISTNSNSIFQGVILFPIPVPVAVPIPMPIPIPVEEAFFKKLIHQSNACDANFDLD